jgi:hypothetical protein
MCSKCFKHLSEKQIGYCDHLKQAWWIAWQLTKTIPKMLWHGLWPDAYSESASDVAKEVLEKTHPGARIQYPDRKKPF